MTLYHYVTTKEELLALLTDTVMGEVVVPDDELPLPADWRAALTVIATRSRAAYARHPWMFDVPDGPSLGPNGIRHFDQTLQAVSGLDLPLSDRLDIVLTVDEYVFGHCTTTRAGDGPAVPVEAIEAMAAHVTERTHPALHALVAEHGPTGTWRVVDHHLRDPDRFTRNLARLLDGLERSLP
jgi:hypothetical protein